METFAPSVFGKTVAGGAVSWGLQGHDGFVRAAGVGGPITGFGADLLICDDLLKNFEEAQSETVRRSTWDWFLSTAWTRLEPEGAAIMIASRWHDDDPVGRIQRAVNEGEMDPWDIINLPAIAEEDEPNWPNGLCRSKGDALWSERFNVEALENIRRSIGEHWFACLYQQRPVPLGGAMFKEVFFSQRVKAAPFHSKRIRYWDRASTSADPSACYTAGVLMARDDIGNFFVEDVAHGQWEPDERNQVMLATALRDREKYGPNNDPTIFIEREGGSSGRDAWKGIARILAGFRVKEDAVTGKKEVRAEPWASQLAAKNVWLVESGTWDINGYISEHVQFPRGRLKDRVDASSGGFNLLIQRSQSAGTIRILGGGKPSEKLMKIVVCNLGQMAQVEGTGGLRRADLILADPDGPDEPVLSNGKDQVEVRFSTLDPKDFQEDWDAVVPGQGRPARELMMSREHGKKIWSFVLRKRDASLGLLVIRDEDADRSKSVAYALCDVLRLPRRQIHCLGDPDDEKQDGPAPCRHIFEMTRVCRGMVV